MREEKLGQLLSELAKRSAEPVRPGLAEDIKQRIPQHLPLYRAGRDTINIIIDLRINKLAAAAVIILTLLLFANFLGGKDSNGLYQDSKLVAKYLLSGQITQGPDVAAAMLKYKYLTEQGKDVAFYGDIINPQDSNAILMQWRLSDGRFRVMFNDLREKTVSPAELIKLQTRMLQGKAR